MTSPKLPTAAEALSLAFAIVATPCSAAETARAMALFEIGRELRVASDMREINARRAAADRLRTDLDISRSRDKLSAAGIPNPAAYEPTQVFPQVANYAGETAAVRFDRVAQAALTESTQRMPIAWAIGDKADCRHCHTPIECVEIAISGAPAGVFPPSGQMWRHKYTDQATCVVPAVAGDVEGSEPTHTFAQPEPRG